MRRPAGRRATSILMTAAVAALAWLPAASAGEIADKAALAERLLGRGYAEAGLAALDKATGAFWEASPLQLRAVAFADSVEGYGNYVPRASSVFAKGDTLRLYLEPVGYGFVPDGDGVRAGIAIDLEIRTPGGIILGSAKDFAQLQWKGRRPMHEVQGTVATPLPDLKPGEYVLILTLRDQASAKTKEISLPFSVAG